WVRQMSETDGAGERQGRGHDEPESNVGHDERQRLVTAGQQPEQGTGAERTDGQPAVGANPAVCYLAGEEWCQQRAKGLACASDAELGVAEADLSQVDRELREDRAGGCEDEEHQ